jgi:hypothetical protein
LSLEPDVRVLAVHHSADATNHAAGEVPAILRGYFATHTGPAKGWPDIAYNFLIDRYGGVWEGRTGSIDAAVRGDATGGNQGFTQLVCLIGNFTTEMPTDAAIASLVSTLRWLSARHGIDVRPGVTATFVSRGSNRWSAGAQVTVPTICGHRELSKTACPGNRFFPFVRDSLPVVVSGSARPATATTTTTTAPPPTTTTSAAPPTNSSSSTTAPPVPASPPSTAGPGDAVSSGAAAASERTTGDNGSAVPTVAAAGTAVGVAGVVGAAVVARRRRQAAE